MPENNESMEELNLDELALVGRIEDSKQFTKKLKIKMHTIDNDENSEVLKKTSMVDDAIEKFDVMKKWTLIYATDLVNDKPISLKQKETLVLKKFQKGTTDKVYDFYTELVAKQEEAITEVKKN